VTTLATAWMLGCVCGFFLGVTVASRRRPTCRELMRDRNRQPTFAELLMPQRGGNIGADAIRQDVLDIAAELENQ
jgi:hypothetical protein